MELLMSNLNLDELKKIADQLKLIPNNFPVCSEDLEEIFSQDEIQH